MKITRAVAHPNDHGYHQDKATVESMIERRTHYMHELYYDFIPKSTAFVV